MTYFQVSHLSKSFGGLRAIDDLSFTLKRGETLAIIGPNGAGKTTLFNVMGRFYNPCAGSITFKGQDLLKFPSHALVQLKMARTFQNGELFARASVLQNLLMARHGHLKNNFIQELLFLPRVRKAERLHREYVEFVMDLLEIQHTRHKSVGSLPFGVRKMVELARALCTEPELLLLDEPSAGLNNEETQDMACWLEDIKQKLAVTLVLIEHDMNLVKEVSDRVLVMHNGKKMAAGSLDYIQNHPAVIKAYLGASCA